MELGLFFLQSSKASKIKTYVGTDGKIHFTDSAGADAVLNFNSTKGLTVLEVGQWNITLTKSQDTTQNFYFKNTYTVAPKVIFLANTSSSKSPCIFSHMMNEGGNTTTSYITLRCKNAHTNSTMTFGIFYACVNYDEYNTFINSLLG